MTKYIILCTLFCFALVSNAQNTIEKATSASKKDWWREAKFGMFIHFNASTVRGKSEWGMLYDKVPVAQYKTQLSEFNPVQLDMENWVKLAKDAGQKYMVYTTKHHDGCANFKSADPFNVVDATAYKKDIVEQFVLTCRKYGMKFGFYYSQAQDWSHPGGAISSVSTIWDAVGQTGNFDTYLATVALPQVKELCRRYPDVSVLWWDTPANMTAARAQIFKTFTDSLPNIIHCDRLGGSINQDFKTPELNVPDAGYPGYDWETCMTMNNHWGYYEGDNKWKSATDLLRMLIDINSKGGNLLLNIGPDKLGVVPQPSVDALKTIGAWMNKNGDAIYATTLISPLTKSNLPWSGRVTGKTVAGVQKLYLHLFDYIAGSALYVPVSNTVTKAYLLAEPQNELTFTKKTNCVTVNLPNTTRDSIATVVVLEYSGTLAVSTGNTFSLVVKGNSAVTIPTLTSTANALRVAYQDQLGTVIAGRKVTAEVTTGGDYVKIDGAAIQATDSNGEAFFSLKTTRFPGKATIKVASEDGKLVTFTVSTTISSSGCIQLKGY